MSYRCTLVIQASATAQQLFLSGSRSLLKHDLQKHVIICKQVHSFYTVCALSLCPITGGRVFCTGKHRTSLQMSRYKVKINHKGLYEKHLVHIPTYWATFLRVNSLLHF